MATRTTDITRIYRRLTFLFGLLSFVATFGPLIYWGIQALMVAKVAQRLVLGSAFAITVILVVLNLLFKYKLRSPIYILIFAVAYVVGVEALMSIFLMVGIGTILDEFIFYPLYKHYKTKASINHELDQRR